MLRTSLPPYNEAVKIVVDQLLREDYEVAYNRRTSYRSPLVRPALIYVPDEEKPRSACTRNISADGVGMLLDAPLADGQTMKVQIHTLSGPNPKLLSELRWCVPFGANWYLSGWKFIAVARDQD